jgi:large subunit ribosomal protein L33
LSHTKLLIDSLFKIKGDFMAKGARENIKLKSSESSEVYWTRKNKRNTTKRLELKKYDKKLRRHVIFKEAK